MPGTAGCCGSCELCFAACAALRERRRLNREHQPSRAQAQPRLWDAAVGSFREASRNTRSARFLARVSRARCEELATRSSAGDGGTGGSSLGVGDDGATTALGGRPVGWLPLRGATSRAGRTGCCAVLRGLVAGERCRGRPGRAGAVWAGRFSPIVCCNGGAVGCKGGKGGSKVIIDPGPLFQASSKRISAGTFLACASGISDSSGVEIVGTLCLTAIKLVHTSA